LPEFSRLPLPLFLAVPVSGGDRTPDRFSKIQAGARDDLPTNSESFGDMEIDRFTDLIQQHAGLIYKIALAYCRDSADRDDVFQEIALQLWRSRGRYNPEFRETTWIYRVAINVAISFYRRERRHRHRRVQLTAAAIVAPGGHDSEPGDFERLRRLLDELQDLDKALVLLSLEGHDHAAISEVFGISVSHVGTKLHRIRQKLQAAAQRESNDGPHKELR